MKIFKYLFLTILIFTAFKFQDQILGHFGISKENIIQVKDSLLSSVGEGSISFDFKKLEEDLNKDNDQDKSETVSLQNKEISEINQKTNEPGALKKVSEDHLGEAISPLLIDEIIKQTNIQRKENGLPVLTTNQKLNLSSEDKVEDMFLDQYFEHVSKKGLSIGDLVNKVGYQYIVVGENLALGDFKSEADLVEAWMESPGHRANILNKNYTEIGVSIKKGIYESRETYLAVQHFGTSKENCLIVNEDLKNTIDQNQKTLSSLKENIDEQNQGMATVINSLNSDFKKMVEDYNNLVLETKNQIDDYNKQVSDYNDCLSKFGVK